MLIDWPGTMPTTHAPDVDLVNVRTCARLSSSTCSSSRLSLLLASRLLAEKEKPSVIPSSLRCVQRIIFIILSVIQARMVNIVVVFDCGIYNYAKYKVRT